MFTSSSKFMIKFIKKLFVFVLVITVMTMAVNSVYVKRCKADTDKFVSIPETIQICNFGSSHSMNGFNYEDIENDYACFNFGLSGQSLSYDYRLFQYYSDRIADGAVVFIPISYFSLFGPEEINDVDFESKNKRYYSILPASMIKEYDLKTDIYVKYIPALGTSPSSFIATMLGKPIAPVDMSGQRVSTDINISESARLSVFVHITAAKFYDIDGNRIENQEEISSLYALIKGCQEKGAIPVLITTPYLHEYTDTVKENAGDFYDHFYSIIDQVVKDTGAEYYDYAFDKRFANEYSWFRDAHHLNNEGGRNFVDILMREIVYAKGYY